MNNFQLKKLVVSDLEDLFAHLERDFPKNERIPTPILRKTFNKGWQAAYFLKDSQPQPLGYLVYDQLEDYPCVHIHYLAILPEHRSSGYGGKMLTSFQEYIGGQGILLEVEDPKATKLKEEEEIRSKRISFYKKLGLQLIEDLTLNLWGVEMLAMKTPLPVIKNYRKTFKKVYRNILGSRLLTFHIKVRQK